MPQPLIVEQLREFGIEISTGQVNRLLTEEKADFHTEQQEVLRAGLETAEYVHTDDTSARHQGHNGYCTVIGNDLFAYNSRSDSKSRENYLRLLRGQYEDYILNEYARTYLIAQQLPQSHLIKLQFSSARVAQGKADWQAYLQRLDITSQQAVKRVTEAAMFGSAIEHGLSPDLILLSDGAKQFAILTHALCWKHTWSEAFAVCLATLPFLGRRLRRCRKTYGIITASFGITNNWLRVFPLKGICLKAPIYVDSNDYH